MKFKSLALAGLLTVGVSANAATIIFNHSGTATQFFGSAYFFANTTSNNLGTLPTSQINFLYNPVTNIGSGQIFRFDGVSNIDITVVGTGSTTTSGSFESSFANIKLDNGFGIFAGLTGTGTLSLTRTFAGQIVQGALSAEVVPEPASMAVLAFGVAALARRRRKQA